MRILITTVPFYPSIGGLNPIAYLSAREWLSRGHEVRLLTRNPGRFDGEDEFPIFRCLSFRQMLTHYKWADVVFQNHVSIHFWLPLLAVRRPYVVSMSGWVTRRAGGGTGKPGLPARARYLLMRWILRMAARNIGACAAVAAANEVPARVIPNPFDSTRFQNTNPSYEDRSSAVLFAGRLVADKGVDDLIRAIALLKTRSIICEVVVAGDGPELGNLLELSRKLSVADQISFVGPKSPTELATLMNQHRVMVVPSKWNEPIAIVALEAMACGCVVVGSEGGGLAVTIGPCGLTYPNGDYELLADRLADILAKGSELTRFTDRIAEHLERYLPERVCGEYLEVLEQAHRRKLPI
jgi:glycogen(starch) synthase